MRWFDGRAAQRVDYSWLTTFVHEGRRTPLILNAGFSAIRAELSAIAPYKLDDDFIYRVPGNPSWPALLRVFP